VTREREWDRWLEEGWALAACAAVVVALALPWPAAGQAAPPMPASSPAAASAPSVAPAPGELGFRFHGYLRSGFGVDGEGKGQEPFKAPLAPAKYRLGNEAETYLETTFAYGVQPEPSESAYFDTQVTIGYTIPTSSNNNFDTTVALREAFARARGVWPAQPRATFWAGERFYQRQDVHIQDYYYNDPSGFGGGLEGVALGDQAKLAIAWIGGAIDQLNPNGTVPVDERYRFNKNTFDVRAYDLPVAGWRLAAVLDLSFFQGDEVFTGEAPILVEDNVGAAGVLLAERPFDGGRYKAVVQYGVGAASNFVSVLTPPVGRSFVPGEVVDLGAQWTFEVVSDLLLERRGNWGLQVATEYEELDNGAATNSRIRWVSAGGRPVYWFSRYGSVAVEAGWDHTSQEGLQSGSLFKLSVAPQITPEVKFLSRPAIRAFFTWANWTKGFEGSVAPLAYGDATRGIAAGVQLESWW
jgi:maltoporin